MLELKNIFKSYTTGNFKQIALNDVSLKFKKHEFVSILGPSGSGKTTLLNIIGGLDKYDDGDLIIKEKSTKKFKDKDFDSYRNKSVGFIFQNYNLISHIDILSNVEMGMTLSGKSIRQRRKIAKELLTKVGLKDHIHKRPNQLSGGQMQRVAIARALANNPEIILADEPTGALDSKTSKQIMELIKEISKDKLVIMVTHNDELAKKYSDRIITMKDGCVTSDSNKEVLKEEKEEYKLKKTKMSFFTALYLSLNNIRTKKGRTILTAFASSIGIIGISLILSLSNGFSLQIDKFERDTSDAMPVIISSVKQSTEAIEERMSKTENKEDKYLDKKEITIDKEKNDNIYNNINDEFMNHVSNINKKYISSIGLKYDVKLNLIQKDEDKYYTLDSLNENTNSLLYRNSLEISPIPFKNFSDKSVSEIITNYYDILNGRLPNSYDEMVLEISKTNEIKEVYKKALGINKDNITFDDVLNSTIKLVFNDNFYKNINNFYVPNIVDKNMYDNENNLTIKIVGIIRAKEEKDNVISSSSSLLYPNEFIDYVINKNNESSIVKSQNDLDYNIFTGQKFEDNETGKKMKDDVLKSLGKISNPSNINLYPKDFKSKDKIIDYLDEYNKGKKEEDKIAYLDQAKLITNISDGIMSGITAVLVAFSSISLIVSSIMIGIITYISVLERVKEIGILRSLGARKKDIRRVFNAETFIIGLSSGLLGILISRLLLIPINSILKSITDLDNVAVMDYKYAFILIVVSIILTLIGGMIPSKIASKKNPVESLRAE